MKGGELITKHGYANTNGVLDTVWYSNNRIRISDLNLMRWEFMGVKLEK